MIRIGIDFGGTKIEAAALGPDGGFLARQRAPNPGDYRTAVQTIVDLVAQVEQAAGAASSRIGIGHPGSISPVSGLIRNANSTWLNDRPFGVDVEAVREQIETRTRFVARTGEEFEALTSGYIIEKTGILVNFGLAVGLGFVIGLIVTGQTFFNFTLDNLRYFASLKAMGASTPRLIGMVLTQVITVTLLAYGIGVGVAAIAGGFIRQAGLAFAMPWQVLALTLVAMMLVAVLSAILSLVKVIGLEAGVVFRA